MKNPFKSYKAEYEMACRVMGAMAEEIVNLRKDNEKLRAEIVATKSERDDLRDMYCAQGNETGNLRKKMWEIRDIVNAKM